MSYENAPATDHCLHVVWHVPVRYSTPRALKRGWVQYAEKVRIQRDPRRCQMPLMP